MTAPNFRPSDISACEAYRSICRLPAGAEEMVHVSASKYGSRPINLSVTGDCQSARLHFTVAEARALASELIAACDALEAPAETAEPTA